LWLAGTVFAVWGFCTLLFSIEAGEFVSNLQYAVMVTLIVTACVFRSTARQTTTRLAQQRIEAAALDTDMKRARLQLLRAQIEPHFLFNTLANVRSLARIDRSAAVDMLNNLMRYFSEALPKLRQDQTVLEDELHLIDSYLRIHQTRMGKRLSFDLQVPDEVLNERIPSMLLLTLVENAIKHGINPSIDGGSIQVTAGRTLDALVLQVRDSGKGLSSTAGHGTGLANIRRRLSMFYGEEAELSLAAASPRGVIATVSIPRTLA
jgi:sensor histidine kinase YesM